MKRGDLYLAELFPRSGSELRGFRPVLVVSHDAFNRVPEWRSVTVVPLTTSGAQARRGPTAIPIPDDVLAAVEVGMRAALGLVMRP